MERFEEFKDIILERARLAEACREQYGRAYRAEDFPQLMEVIRDNFRWAVTHKVVDGDLIDAYREEFAAGKIWHNEDVRDGYLLATGNSTVEATGNSTVEATGNSTVEATGNSTVEAYGNSTVKAYDSSTVEAYGNSTVKATGSSTVKAYDSSTVKAYGNSTVKATGSSTVEAYGNSTVKATGNSYITSYNVFECKLSGKALWRITRLNTIRYCDPEMKFEKVEETPQ